MLAAVGRRASRGEAGQALVELALSLSVLVFGLIGAADFARAFAAQIGVLSAARAGAEAGVIKVATTDAAIVSWASDELGRVPGVDPANATITVTHSLGEAGEALLTVRVQYPFRTLVAWPIVPSQLDLDRSVTMRKYT